MPLPGCKAVTVTVPAPVIMSVEAATVAGPVTV